MKLTQTFARLATTIGLTPTPPATAATTRPAAGLAAPPGRRAVPAAPRGTSSLPSTLRRWLAQRQSGAEPETAQRQLGAEPEVAEIVEVIDILETSGYAASEQNPAWAHTAGFTNSVTGRLALMVTQQRFLLSGYAPAASAVGKTLPAASVDIGPVRLPPTRRPPSGTAAGPGAVVNTLRGVAAHSGPTDSAPNTPIAEVIARQFDLDLSQEADASFAHTGFAASAPHDEPSTEALKTFAKGLGMDANDPEQRASLLSMFAQTVLKPSTPITDYVRAVLTKPTTDPEPLTASLARPARQQPSVIEHLGPFTLTKTPNPGGGDCLFHAVAGQNLSPNRVLLRRNALAALLQPPPGPEPDYRAEVGAALEASRLFAEDRDLNRAEVKKLLDQSPEIGLDQYRSIMGTPGIHTGEMELAALAKNLKQSIHVLVAMGGGLQLNVYGPDGTREVHDIGAGTSADRFAGGINLLLKDGHYERIDKLEVVGR
jgi:hypothetical protein